MERREQIRAVCGKHGARLCEDQIFYDDDHDKAWALIEVPDEAEKQKAFLRELRPIKWRGVVNADEKHGGKRPPPSKPHDDGADIEVAVDVIYKETTETG